MDDFERFDDPREGEFTHVDPLYAEVTERLVTERQEANNHETDLCLVRCADLAAELRKAMKEQTP